MTRDTHNDRRVVLVDFCGTVVDFPTSVEFTRFVAQRMPTPHSRRVERAIALSHRLRVTGVLRHLLPRASVVKRMNAYKLRGYSRGQLLPRARAAPPRVTGDGVPRGLAPRGLPRVGGERGLRPLYPSFCGGVWA